MEFLLLLLFYFTGYRYELINEELVRVQPTEQYHYYTTPVLTLDDILLPLPPK